jgi:hypothetical protein
MRKITFILLAIVAISAFVVSACFAQSAEETYTISATVLPATAVSINVSKIIGLSWTPVTGNDLSFDPLEYNSTFGWWAPEHHFAIDVGTDGAGNPDTTFTYINGSNPNNPFGGPEGGLGYKAGMAFFKVDADENETEIQELTILQSIDGFQVTSSQVSGGFLRAYLGILVGDEQGDFPPGGEPFTNADAAGVYSGTLLVSATMQ